MRCLECGGEIAERAQVCARCGSWAPVEYQLYVADDRAADAAGGRAPAAIHASVGQQRLESVPDPDVDGAELANRVATREFSTTRLRPGYDIEEVDAFVGAIRDTFLGVRESSLTPEEIRAKQFSTTRLRPGYDKEEVDAFLDEAESRLAAQDRVCSEAAAAEPESGAGDPAAGVVSSRARHAASATTASAAGQAMPEFHVPGRLGAKVSGRLRRVPRGYSWMAWGTVFGGWALVAVGGYFYNLSSPSDRWYFLAGIAPVVVAAILFGWHIRWSLFLRRPSDGCSATVTACRRGGHALLLDAPWDGYPSGLKIRLAWWAEPEMLLPGENVTFYGRRGGVGMLLVSSPARGRAFVGTGRRRPARLAGEAAVQDVPHQPGGRRVWRRHLRWGPLVIFGLGLVAAVGAMLIATVPSLTGHLGAAQFRAGDCFTSSNRATSNPWPWPDWVTAVPCADPHLAEVFFAGNAWPQSLAYPGDYAISDQENARCESAFSAYDGIDSSESIYMIDIIGPWGDNWASGNRWLVCIADVSINQGGAPAENSIKGTGK